MVNLITSRLNYTFHISIFKSCIFLKDMFIYRHTTVIIYLAFKKGNDWFKLYGCENMETYSKVRYLISWLIFFMYSNKLYGYLYHYSMCWITFPLDKYIVLKTWCNVHKTTVLNVCSAFKVCIVEIIVDTKFYFSQLTITAI